MTIRELYKHYLTSLKAIYPPGEASAITDIVFRRFNNISKSTMLIRGNEITDDATMIVFENALAKLLQHIPVQYITGEAWFYNLKFHVNENVLIPRPETEELVQEAVNFLKGTLGKKLLDIGTGSGCIPISIKKNIPDAEIISLDISTGALQTAAENAAANKVAVDFRQIDFLDERIYSTLPVFDVIISNPPYIPANEKGKLDKNVTMHEPHLALFVPDNDPFIFYRKIFLFAKEHLAKNGKIFLEIHEDYSTEIAAIFSAGKFLAEIKIDISGKDRMLMVTPRQ